MEVTMNNLYHWHNEVIVATKMADTLREMDSIRLLHDAGLANPGLFERSVIALGKGLIWLGQRLYKDYTEPQRAYQLTSGKIAS
jgi:hypothetical protein